MRASRLIGAGLVSGLAVAFTAGVVAGCGGETVEVGSVIEDDPRENEDVMRRTEEYYKKKMQAPQGR